MISLSIGLFMLETIKSVEDKRLILALMKMFMYNFYVITSSYLIARRRAFQDIIGMPPELYERLLLNKIEKIYPELLKIVS